MMKVLNFLVLMFCVAIAFGQADPYIEQSTPNPAAAKLFFYDRTYNQDTERNWRIATLPVSGNGTGDKIMIELFGGEFRASSTFQQIIHVANRGGFEGHVRATYGNQHESVRIRAYEQPGGEVDVFMSLLPLSWKGGSVRVYEGSAITVNRPVIYREPQNVGPNPSGTLVFDSYTEVPGLVVTNAGSVGIGTNSPLDKLHVEGKVLSRSTQPGIILVENDGPTDENWWIDNSDGSLRFLTVDENLQSWQTILKIDQQSGNVVSTYLAGKVGIGTTSPSAKLTVDGDILAEKVKVVTEVSDVPDYVFKEDYNLRSLADVAAYINENRHLPEVPSAEEIAADGHDVAAMNLLLLKKIEELTLYLIAKDKEISVLKRDREVLFDVLDRLDQLEANAK